MEPAVAVALDRALFSALHHGRSLRPAFLAGLKVEREVHRAEASPQQAESLAAAGGQLNTNLEFKLTL